MTDRTAKAWAVAFVGIAVGIVGWWSSGLRGARLKLVEQRTLGPKMGPLGCGPGILVSVDLTGIGDRLVSDCQMRLWDERGRELKITPLYLPGQNDYLVPIGYGKPIQSPRLEAWLEGKKLASVALAAFPPPQTIALTVRPDPNYHLVRYQTKATPETLATTTFHLMPKPSLQDDVQRVETLIKTDHLDLSRDKLPGDVLLGANVPYGDEATSGEVWVKTYRQSQRSEVISLPAIRLAEENGETRAVVDRELRIANHLGCDLRLRPTRPSSSKARRDDPRNVDLTISTPLPDPQKAYLEQPNYSVQLLSPSAKDVALKSLTINGFGTVDAAPRRKPPSTLGVVVRITRRDYALIGDKRLVLPVEEGKGRPPNPLPTDVATSTPRKIGIQNTPLRDHATPALAH